MSTSIDINKNTKPVDFADIAKGINTVLENHYPVLSNSLRKNREKGLDLALQTYTKLLNRGEKKFTDTFDEKQVARNEDWIKQRKLFNRKKAADLTILNPERALFLPQQVQNSLKSLRLGDKIPIDDRGNFLMPIGYINDDFMTINNKQISFFDKQGNTKRLNQQILHFLIRQIPPFDKLDLKQYHQFPEVRILKTWINKRGKFNSELQKISKQQKDLANPTKMSNRILQKLKKHNYMKDYSKNELTQDDVNRYMAPADLENAKNYARILQAKNMNPSSKRTYRVKDFFFDFLSKGKLKDEAKIELSKYMQNIPYEINKFNV